MRRCHSPDDIRGSNQATATRPGRRRGPRSGDGRLTRWYSIAWVIVRRRPTYPGCDGPLPCPVVQRGGWGLVPGTPTRCSRLRCPRATTAPRLGHRRGPERRTGADVPSGQCGDDQAAYGGARQGRHVSKLAPRSGRTRYPNSSASWVRVRASERAASACASAAWTRSRRSPSVRLENVAWRARYVRQRFAIDTAWKSSIANWRISSTTRLCRDCAVASQSMWSLTTCPR
jgi:hypothetical protein